MTGTQLYSLETEPSSDTVPSSAEVQRTRSSDSLTLVYAAIVFLVLFAFLLWRSSRFLADGDTYWHLAVGEHILRTFSFPTLDEYSYTRAGAPWIAKEWLSQVLFYIVYSIGGWFGIVAFSGAIAAFASSILFAWLCQRVQPIVALTMTTVTFSLGMGTLLARPEIFFYPLLTLCACGLVGAVEGKKTPWWLPLLVALWANLHASFPIALVLAALFALEAVVSAAPGERLRTAANWGLVLAVSIVATGATPYGYQPLLISTQIVGASEVNAIDEWRPMGFNLIGAYGAAFIAGSLAILASARAGWTRAAPLFLCAALMARHVRFFPLFAIVAAPALATPIAGLLPRFARRHSAPSPATRKAATTALSAACLATILSVPFAPRPVPAARMAPTAALEIARRLPVSGNVYNAYPFGGFLIFKGVKTFVDGRAELYFNGLLKRAWDAEWDSSDAPFLALLQEYHVTWALLVPGTEPAAKLRRSTQWREVFQDDYSELFVRS